MIRVRILKPCSGSPDGITVIHYESGTEHDLPDDLAKVFIEMGVAGPVEDKTAVPAEDKAVRRVRRRRMMA